jgi:hypothetical protein
MNITHVTKDGCRQKWILEPHTAMEYSAVEKFISSLKDEYDIDIAEISESSAQVKSDDPLQHLRIV